MVIEVLFKEERCGGEKKERPAQKSRTGGPKAIIGVTKRTPPAIFNKNTKKTTTWGGGIVMLEGHRKKSPKPKKKRKAPPKKKSHPFMWLVNYSVKDEHREESKRVISLLPERVREAINKPFS